MASKVEKSTNHAIHRVLNIPDIVRLIVSYLPPKALAAAAGVSWDWFYLATDALWRNNVHVRYLQGISEHRRPFYSRKINNVRLDVETDDRTHRITSSLPFDNVLVATFIERTRQRHGVDLTLHFITPNLQELELCGYHNVPSLFWTALEMTCSDLRRLWMWTHDGYDIVSDWELIITITADQEAILPNLKTVVADEQVVKDQKEFACFIIKQTKLKSLLVLDHMAYLVSRQVLLACAGNHNLKELVLDLYVTDETLNQLFALKHSSLRSLRLLGLSLRSVMVPQLVSHCTSLRQLTLSIDDDGDTFLSAIGQLHGLRVLNLAIPAGTQVSGAALVSLRTLTELEVLGIRYRKRRNHYRAYGDPIPISLADFRALVAGFNKLVALQVPVLATLEPESLEAVAVACPRLKVLEIAGLKRFEPMTIGMGVCPMFPNLKHFLYSDLELFARPVE